MKMNARRLTADAVLVALYVVLSFVSLNFGFLKLSFALLPVFLCALCFGATDAMIVGALAAFIQQMLTYGFTATTVLWMLPPIVLGAIVGLYAQAKRFALTTGQHALIIAVGCVAVTTINTIVMLIDGRVYGYPVAFTFSVVALRYISSIAMAVIYTIVVPRAVKLICRSGLIEGRRAHANS